MLTVLAGVAITPAVARLVQLTTREHAELKARAEAKLITRRWEPTIRGRILDRKGRVLAQDHPSFDLAVEYPVITGEWAFEQAGDAARKAAGPAWRKLPPLERERRIQEEAKRFSAELHAGWARFAELAEVAPEEIAERRAAIIAEVSRQAMTAQEAQRVALEEEINLGFELTEDLIYTEVPTAEVSAPIREQRSWHVIVHDVADEVAFRFPLVAAPRNVPASGSAASSTSGASARNSPRSGNTASTVNLPGLHLIDGSGREYPNETLEVLIARDSFPGPLKNAQPLRFTVRGVMTQIVGWMRTRPLDQDYWWQEQVAREGAPGKAPARRAASDEDLAAWVDERLNRPRSNADGSKSIEMPQPPPARAYSGADSVGATGVEWSLEQTLRGDRGSVEARLDSGAEQHTERTPGGDARLTIDAALQARVMALMSPDAGLAVVQPWHHSRALPEGTTLSGGAVVIEVDTGDILALVSTPTFSRAQLRAAPETIFDDAFERPAISKAFGRPYPPGSIVKPLMYTGAVALGVMDVAKRFECNGHLYPDQPNIFRCWIYKQAPHITHSQQLGGPLDAASAIMASCNIYFFSVGRLLGPERVARVYEMFGVGARADQAILGLGVQYAGSAGRAVGAAPTPVPKALGETAGDNSDLLDSDATEMGLPTAPVNPLAPMRAATARRPLTGLSLSEATLMGIGQGPVAWTPLHAADAYATLARGGTRIVPRLRIDEPPRTTSLGLDPRSVEMALEGLRKAVNEDRGTGHHITTDAVNTHEPIFNVPGVSVWGKSGTADSGMRAKDAFGQSILDDAGRPVSIDHAWFVALAGDKGGRPKYAIALIVERGGSGGRVSGPLCNQIIHALVAEGYLGGGATPPANPASTVPARTALDDAANLSRGGGTGR
ncbi:hypothetical protein BH11PLA1_BH11PLA1_09040 [soil metagenome]